MITGINLSYSYNPTYYKTIRNIESYSHVKNSYGGDDSMSASINMDVRFLPNFILNVFGKKIKAYIGNTVVVWFGVVNEISFNYGNLNIVVGPYLEIVNKVLVKYTEFSTGVPGITTYANNINSQTTYGTLVKVLNGGSISSVNANSIRDSYINYSSYPDIKQSIADSGQPTSSITLNCVGIHRLLDTYVYNSSSGNITLTNKIQNVLKANPNTEYSTDYTTFYTNPLQVSDNENSYNLASSVIKELIVLGDGTSNNYRTVFGFYGNNKPVYKYVPPATPTNFSYFYDMKNDRYFDKSSRTLHPAEINSAEYLKILGPNYSYSRELNSDMSVMFIENVNFTAPNSISISGEKFGTLPQQLAKLGISGL